MSGLLISVALWGLSYANHTLYRGNRFLVSSYGGHIQYLRTDRPWSEWGKSDRYSLGWQVDRRYDLNTLWKPWCTFATWYWTVYVPLWMPTLLFGGVFWRAYPPVYRLHKWRKLWLCLTCGYDLTGNTSGTCPECGDQVT